MPCAAPRIRDAPLRRGASSRARPPRGASRRRGHPGKTPRRPRDRQEAARRSGPAPRRLFGDRRGPRGRARAPRPRGPRIACGTGAPPGARAPRPPAPNRRAVAGDFRGRIRGRDRARDPGGLPHRGALGRSRRGARRDRGERQHGFLLRPCRTRGRPAGRGAVPGAQPPGRRPRALARAVGVRGSWRPAGGPGGRDASDRDRNPSAGRAGMKVLVVEDDAETGKGLEQLLQEFGLRVQVAGTLAEGRAALATFDPDVCLTDLQLPDGNGIDFIRAARAADSRREVVVLTGHGSLDTAVEAMKAGAFDYLVKPLRLAQLEAVLERLRPGRPSGIADAGLWKVLDETGRFGTMIGVSPSMREMCAIIARIARSDAPVMITGESGSGKEAAAQTIHMLSRRSDKPIVAINCGAVSSNLIESELFGHERGAFTGADKRRAGYFELAQGGTLFLDEVTEMPPELQVKFLRVLETRSFRRVGGNEEIGSDVRIISSSNRYLLEAVERKTLREDLYYRLNVFPLHIVPLRERREDVPVLAKHFLDLVAENEEGGRRTFSAAALEKLAVHAWPGNVRELRNVVHCAYVLSDDGVVDEATVVSVLAGRSSGVFPAVRPPARGASTREKEAAESRPPAVPAPAAQAPDDPLQVPVRVGDSLEEVERRLLKRTLAAVGGNKRKAAEMLRVSLKTVYNKIKQYEIER